MIKRIQKLLGGSAMAPFTSFLSNFSFKKSVGTLLVLLLLGSGDMIAQGVSLSFSNGYLGTQNSAVQSTSNIKNLASIGISRVSFSQSYSGSFGGTQGNDLSGTIKLYLNTGSVVTLSGALNWRETIGNTVEVFGLIFDPGQNASIAYGNNQIYNIVGGSTNGSSTSLGLRAYASSLVFVDGESRSGNAATSGIIANFNTELANSPQPSSISLSNTSVIEGQNLVYTVTLSSATTSGRPQVYVFNTSGSAVKGSDYSATYTFSNGVVNNGDGTITVPGGVSSFTVTVSTTDDALVESIENLLLTVGSKLGIGSIADNDDVIAANCDPNSLYDNIVSGYHQSIAKKSDGSFSVWGNLMGSNGTSNILSPQNINSTNYPGLSGSILKAAVAGAASSTQSQAIILTTDGLYAWGSAGNILATSLTSNLDAFAKIGTPLGGDANTKLPTGVTPGSIKMMVAFYQTLVLVTNSGSVWILTQTNGELRGIGTTTAATTTWNKVKIDANTELKNVISVRGMVDDANYNGLMALTADGKAYVWGKSVYLGNGTAATSKSYATQMTLPAEFNDTNLPKMIAVTGGNKTAPSTCKNTFYILSTSGALYALGDNQKRQIGDFSIIERTSWVRAKINSTTDFTDINYISAMESDPSDPAIVAITKSGTLYTWGFNPKNMIGRPTANISYDPGIPTGFTVGTDKAIFAEMGGHTLVYIKEGSSQFCYVGHRINGSMGDGTTTDVDEVQFNCSGTPSLAVCGSVPVSASTVTSTISANPTSILADGTTTSVITVQLKQANGTNLTSTGGTVVINTNKGSIGNVTDNNDGTYTAILTSSTFNETANITYTLNGSNGTNSTTVTFIPLTPTITNTSNFSSFTTCVGTASSAQSFTVSAANLTSNLTVTAPSGFELATSSSGTYSSSIILTQTSGTVSTTTLWARLKSSTLTSTSGSIELSSTGATSGNISVSAQVSALPTISVNVIPDVTTSATTFSIPFTGLTGADVYSLAAGTTSMTNFAAVSTASVTTSPLVITIPASAQNSYDFILTVANSTSGCSVQRTFSLVVSDINPGTTAADQAICSGTIPAAFTSLTDATAGGAGSPTYQWQMSTTGVAGTYNDIIGATSASYSHPTALTADTYFRRKATIGVAFGTAHPIEVLVNALPTVTVTPSSASITTGSSVTLTATGASIYSWTPSTGLSSTNTASVVASPTATTTYIVTGTNSPSSCASTATVTVTVNSALNAGTISASQTICVGATPATLTSSANASGGTGSITYVWQSSLDGISYTTISGEISSTYSPGAIAVNTYFRRGASTANDAVVYSPSVLITVQESVGGSISGSATVCAGTNSTVLTLSGQTGSITKWQSSLTSNFASATDITNTTTSLTATNLSVTTYYRAVITVGSCTAANSSSASVTVTALPSISITPSSASITIGTNVTLTASGATSYSWSPATGLSATNTAAVSATPSVTTTYTVTGTSSSCSSTASITVTVTAAVSLDTDGDGVLDSQETADGTDPNDVCSYVAASQTLTPTSAWSNADCDGDGTPNGVDTAPKDPCVHAAGATPVLTNAIWRAADCDGDGVTNGKESDDGTDPNNGCDYKVASRTLTPSAAWGALDCDADGNSNATDPHIDAPTASDDVVNVGSSGTVTYNILSNDDFLPGANIEITRQTGANAGTAKGTVTFNPLTGEMTYKRAPFESGLVTMGYRVTNKGANPAVSSFAFITILACDLADPLSDCDGDGEPNGTDLAPTDPCVYEPSRQVKANVSDDWKALDCDGDGVLNGTELLDGTNPADGCSFKAASITLAPSAAWLALDCDADGIKNGVETSKDFDGDGIPNCLDTDSDGDSISDKLETTVDTDKDGKPDYLDLDSDNDGILDAVENKVCTGTGILCDTDADGTPNFRDLDSDGDKINDVIEANGSDYNRDGIADGNIDEKGIPSSANKGLTPPDTDRDGKMDPYDVDSDGDGILDFDEEYNEDADFADCDKDGIANRLDPDECEIFSPQGISPNGDGKNDRLVFKGLYLRKIPNHLSIFNRWGTLVFEMESYDNSFTGTLLPDGTYYYILDFFGKKPTISNYLSVDRTIK